MQKVMRDVGDAEVIPKPKRGLFIVLEGIDGSGTTTQINRLHDYIKGLSKYADVLTTHEPWRSDEIKRMLEGDEDAYSDGEKMTELYIGDRADHQKRLIIPNLNQGVTVLCDRFSLSTHAYQGAQGVDPEKILRMEKQKGIIRPDLTFFLDVDYETARKRIEERGLPVEKFERDEMFARKLIKNYRRLAEMKDVFGRVIGIDGNKSMDEVESVIAMNFDDVFGESYS